MAYEQNFQDPMAQFESVGDVSMKQKWESISASANMNGCFDCNICFDSAHEPVVTFCGHLYCWPCIYKWLHVQTSSSESNEPPKCPVCKANISQSSLVPLYGRGPSEASSESDAKMAHRDAVIPHRPPALGVHTTSMTSHSNQPFSSHPFQSPLQPFHHQQISPHPYGTFPSMASPNFGGTAMIGIFPIVGMFGEMVFTRMFGSSDTSFFADMYSNAYPSVGYGSPRMRRQEMQVDKSLNRVTIFLFCCFILCFLLF
ncbi:E3 ubiquitin-protein like [Actinidia chinensis var. chinensis]|uniref:E3 ubiquitin-protein ligase RMA n=1 Tax=Actinidia chinensis var. chinensis TaxID=1590841 RepID=A0A2R6QBU3_ACTCC|nr:E3 ubiquitin-protein like [Actinidia chinensis var. chinensis]